MIVASAAVALASTAAYVANGGGAEEREAAAGPTVVTAADAVRPREGRDYRLVATLRGRDAPKVAGVTASDEVLLTWWTGIHDTKHNALLDPASGHRTRLPDLGGAATVVEATSRWVTFVRSAPESQVDVVRLDRSTGKRRHFTLPKVRGHYNVLGVEDAAVWFKTGPVDDHVSRDDVWSVRFGRPDSLRHRGRWSTPALADGVLSWVVRSLDGPDVIAVRDAAGGDVTRFTLPEDCQVRSRLGSLLGNGTQVVANTYCGSRSGAGVRQYPTFVVDRTAGVVTELQVESDEAASQASDRMVSFYWYSFDLATGTLYDVSDRTTLSGTPPSTGRGEHPLVVWPRGSDRHDEPTRVLVVRLT